MTDATRKAMRNAAEVLEEKAREIACHLAGAEDDPDCDDGTINVLRREAAKWRDPAVALRSALDAEPPPAAPEGESAPPVCTGTGTGQADFTPMSTSAPTVGRCGICGQTVPLISTGDPMRGQVLATHPYRPEGESGAPERFRDAYDRLAGRVLFFCAVTGDGQSPEQAIESYFAHDLRRHTEPLTDAQLRALRSLPPPEGESGAPVCCGMPVTGDPLCCTSCGNASFPSPLATEDWSHRCPECGASVCSHVVLMARRAAGESAPGGGARPIVDRLVDLVRLYRGDEDLDALRVEFETVLSASPPPSGGGTGGEESVKDSVEARLVAFGEKSDAVLVRITYYPRCLPRPWSILWRSRSSRGVPREVARATFPEAIDAAEKWAADETP